MEIGQNKVGDEALVTQITETLNEPNVDLVRKVIVVLGAERVQAFFQKTLAIEAAGGLTVQDSSRRRTPGGVFFKTVKDGTTSAERWRIFPRPPTPADGATESSATAPSAPPPPTWEEAKALIVKALQMRAEAKTVKMTLIGRPAQVTQQEGCVVVAMPGKPPGALPKGLPTPPANSAITWAVFIVNKQWNKVKESISANAEDQLVIEGYPMVDPKRGVGVVLATNCKSVYQERAQQTAQ
jgi:PHAX RNA-binding domain